MKSLGVYEAAQPRLVFGENVAQTAQFIESGAADVGIIALSLAVAPPMRDKGRYGEVPLDAYPRMEQGGVILRRAQDRAAAEEFKAFLLGPESRSVLKEFGFFLPED